MATYKDDVITKEEKLIEDLEIRNQQLEKVRIFLLDVEDQVTRELLVKDCSQSEFMRGQLSLIKIMKSRFGFLEPYSSYSPFNPRIIKDK